MINKKKFIDALCKNKHYEKLGINFLSEEDSGFFELCQKFIDIPLNATKIKHNNKIEGVFKFSDIEIAKNNAVNYVKDNGIHDVETFMELIRDMHFHALSDAETRQISGVDKNDNPSDNAVGIYGTYYNFTRMPDNVFDKIKNEVLDSIR